MTGNTTPAEPMAYHIAPDGTRLPIFEDSPGHQHYIDQHGTRHDGLFHVPREATDAMFEPRAIIIDADREF